jgi:GntR family transcriptional repressor for pyruvate dehydrogenase complex
MAVPAPTRPVTAGPASPPFVDPVRSLRTFESAIEHIIVGIERARLREADRLPNEGILAEQLGISKPTLGQALRVLERSGRLLIRQGKSGGIFLRSEYLPTDEISTHIATEQDNVLETLRARRILEQAITKEAMLYATADDLAEIGRTVEMLRGDGITGARVLRADAMFHRAVARAAHNRVLEEALQVVYRRLAPLRDEYSSSAEDAARVHKIHHRQLGAMVAGDEEALDRALNLHFRFLEEGLARSLGRSWAQLFGPTQRGPRDPRSKLGHVR